MKRHFRIHGDNIIECERIAKILLEQLEPLTQDAHLSSPSTITIDITFRYSNKEHEWHLDLLPGFNKAGRTRWTKNIFDVLKENGSLICKFYDEEIANQAKKFILNNNIEKKGRIKKIYAENLLEVVNKQNSSL